MPVPDYKVLLVGNYAPDRQFSMRHFATMLKGGLNQRGIAVEVIRPEPVFGRLVRGERGVSKWIGYIDKFVLFPRTLKRRLRAVRSEAVPALVHICDHSNSPYLSVVVGMPHLITCHDLLAVRSALGEFPENPVRWSGRSLQRWIVSGLKRARHVVSVSNATRSDVARICGVDHDRSSVVHNALNHSFRRRERVDALECLATTCPHFTASEKSDPFILHVGSNVWYKNRIGVLIAYEQLLRRKHAAPRLIMVGPEFTGEMKTIAARLPDDRVLALSNVSPGVLESLYSLAELLVFPSLAEGFGWPVLEAMACGCPVVTSGRAPMTEVGGDAAVYCDPRSSQDIVWKLEAVLSERNGERIIRRARCMEQAANFSMENMIDGYAERYRRTLAIKTDEVSKTAGASRVLAGMR